MALGALMTAMWLPIDDAITAIWSPYRDQMRPDCPSLGFLVAAASLSQSVWTSTRPSAVQGNLPPLNVFGAGFNTNFDNSRRHPDHLRPDFIPADATDAEPGQPSGSVTARDAARSAKRRLRFHVVWMVIIAVLPTENGQGERDTRPTSPPGLADNVEQPDYW